MERAWAYATAIININQEAQGKEERFTIPEVKALAKVQLINLLTGIRSIRKPDSDKQASGGSSELSRRIGVGQATINNFVQLLGLSKPMQEKIEEKERVILA